MSINIYLIVLNFLRDFIRNDYMILKDAKTSQYQNAGEDNNSELHYANFKIFG